MLSVHTDRRSDKVAQLRSGRTAELGFWDPAAGEQLRVACAARVATDGEAVDAAWAARSEEHTSELQSLMRISYAVFCLKKKTYTSAHHYRDTYELPSY